MYDGRLNGDGYFRTDSKLEKRDKFIVLTLGG